MWLDSHNHLAASEFDADRESVLDRASESGIECCIAIGSGYGIDRNARAVECAAGDERVFATVGVHPHEAKALDDAGRAKLEQWIVQPRVVAVGECGLDFHYQRSEREIQREVFAEQLELARRCGLPVSIHVRGDEPDAFEEVLEIWRSVGRGELEGVLHCYTGTLEFARRALESDLWISFSGILTFERERGLREVARALPLERLLVETDAPLLSPRGFRGKRNEPARVRIVGEALATILERPVEEVARATTRNARRLFRLPD